MNEFIGKALPWISAAATGNVPALVTMAATAISDVIGLPVAPTKKAIEQAVTTATPEQLQAMQQADQDFAAKMQALGFGHVEELERIAAGDRDSARKANVTGGTHWSLFWLSILLLVVSLGAEALVLFKGYPSGVPDIVVGRVLGLFDAVAMLVLSYWYGTTSGSQQKTELLGRADAIR